VQAHCGNSADKKLVTDKDREMQEGYPTGQAGKPMLPATGLFGSPEEEFMPEKRWARSVNPTALLTPTNRIKQVESVDTEDQSRLLDCGSVSPTCATKPDDPRLEFDEFRVEASRLAKEFFCAKDVHGMVSSISQMESQCFHDELVTVLLRSSLDRKETERNLVVALLHVLMEKKLVTTSQLVRGFEKLVLVWEDLRLDVPDAPGQLVGLLSSKVGLLDKDLFKRLPQGLLQTVCNGFSAGVARDTLQEYVEELGMFKKELASSLEKDISEASIKPFAEWLRVKDMAAFHHEVVLAACTCIVEAAPERSAEKQKIVFEMFIQFSGANKGFCGASDSISDEDKLLTEADLQLGFSRLLGNVAELTKGTPDSLRTIVGLLRAAVEQELLPADFLKTARRLRFGGPLGVQALREAQRQTPAFSRRVWGSGDKRQLQMETREAILEYFDSGSVEELGQIVGELHLSDKELIKFLRKLLVSGMESGESEKSLDAIKELMGFFWSEADVRSAFDELQGIADDLVLDLPHCREATNSLMRTAHGRGILEESYLTTACISAV
jgi:hypothetical protein